MSEAIPSPADEPMHYAGFWVRFFAACIDLILFVPFYFAFKYGVDYFLPHAAAVDGSTDYSTQILPSTASQWIFEIIFDILSLVIYAWFFSSKMQGSPGMYLFKFYIADKEGHRISFLRSFMWCITAVLGWLICFAGILYMQKDIMVAHDMIISCRDQNIDMNDCVTEIEKIIGIPFINFEELIYTSAGLAGFLYLIWALSIGLSKDKTGFHNLICGTRLVKGRA